MNDIFSEIILPIQPTAAHELVVDQLRQTIKLGRFLPGEKLPPERELANLLQVSRTTVREAVRILEKENLLKIKRGAHGGLLVVNPSDISPSNLKSLYSAQEDELNDLFDYRVAIETRAVHLATERKTDEDIAAMAHAITEMDKVKSDLNVDTLQVAKYIVADTLFHTSIAQASKNPYLGQAIGRIRAAMFIPVGANFGNFGDVVDKYHEMIFDAIVGNDAHLAAKLMEEHITIGHKNLKLFINQYSNDENSNIGAE